MDGSADVFQPTQAPSERSPHLSDSRNSLSLSARSRLPSDDGRSFQQMTSRNSTSSVSSTGSYTSNQDRNLYNRTMSFSDANRQGASSHDKQKKLEEEDDNFYQYANNLPGQTQQLMQLHQVSLLLEFLFQNLIWSTICFLKQPLRYPLACFYLLVAFCKGILAFAWKPESH